MAGITAFRQTAQFPAQATAGTAQAVILGRAPKAGTLTAAAIFPVGAVAADTTDIRIWTIQNRGQAGTGTTSMATFSTLNTANGALVAYDEAAFTLSGTAANLVVAAGDIIAVLETTSGAGKVHTGGRINATFDPVYGTN